jgi:hypothetical protein
MLFAPPGGASVCSKYDLAMLSVLAPVIARDQSAGDEDPIFTLIFTAASASVGAVVLLPPFE